MEPVLGCGRILLDAADYTPVTRVVVMLCLILLVVLLSRRCWWGYGYHPYYYGPYYYQYPYGAYTPYDPYWRARYYGYGYGYRGCYW